MPLPAPGGPISIILKPGILQDLSTIPANVSLEVVEFSVMMSKEEEYREKRC